MRGAERDDLGCPAVRCLPRPRPYRKQIETQSGTRLCEVSAACSVAAPSQGRVRDDVGVAGTVVRGLLGRGPITESVPGFEARWHTRLSAACLVAAPSQAGEPGPATGRGLLPAACRDVAPSQRYRHEYARVRDVAVCSLSGRGSIVGDHDEALPSAEGSDTLIPAPTEELCAAEATFYAGQRRLTPVPPADEESADLSIESGRFPQACIQKCEPPSPCSQASGAGRSDTSPQWTCAPSIRPRQ